jgi:hypothetical protein
MLSSMIISSSVCLKIDINILSRDSGFGIVGAMMSVQPKKPLLYKMFLNGSTPRDCGSFAGDDITLFSETWSGL